MAGQADLLIRLLSELDHPIIGISEITETAPGIVHLPFLIEGAEMQNINNWGGLLIQDRVWALRRTYEISGVRHVDLAGLDDEPFGQFDGAVYSEDALCLEVGFDTIRLVGKDLSLRSTFDEETSLRVNLWRTPVGTFRGYPQALATAE